MPSDESASLSTDRGGSRADHLQHGRACYARGAWSDAWQALQLADSDTPLAVDDLERCATAAWLVGCEHDFEQLHERAHRCCLDGDDRPRAAREAFWLSLSLLLRGNLGQASAWHTRGLRAIEGLDCVEQGYLLLPDAEASLREGRAEAARDTAADAAAIGERFGDADLVAAARHVQGRALIEAGQVTDGLRMLDETMLAVVAGELSPVMTGLMYCSVIEACREVYALGRAREWTLALSGWCDRQSGMVAFAGVCLVHRAEILQLNGAWLDAMADAMRARDRAVRLARRPPGAALYQQAEIHRLRGEFVEAEEAYREASAVGYEPQPGLALLRLAQGRLDAAAAAIRRVMSATTDRLPRARLLPGCHEILLASGDIEDARQACTELETLADTFDTDVLRALAAQAKGATALAERDAVAALGPLRYAFEAWQRLEAPYEAARVRVLVAQACRAHGDEEHAALELEAARAAFDALGARPDLARIDALASPSAPAQTCQLTARERHVLRLVAAGRTNKAIAAMLRVSERTVDRHVSNILNKLDVPSRTAATAYAYDHKLIQGTNEV